MSDVKLTVDEIEDMLDRAARRGAKEALRSIGLLDDQAQKDITEMRKSLSDAGLPNLFIPAQDSFIEIEEIPMLGTGKLDLKGAKQMAADLVAAAT